MKEPKFISTCTLLLSFLNVIKVNWISIITSIEEFITIYYGFITASREIQSIHVPIQLTYDVQKIFEPSDFNLQDLNYPGWNCLVETEWYNSPNVKWYMTKISDIKDTLRLPYPYLLKAMKKWLGKAIIM